MADFITRLLSYIRRSRPEIRNIEAGKQFVKTARAILARDFSGQDSTSPFDLEDVLKIADEFNIFGALNCVRGHHWRLVLQVNTDGSMLVYDPLFDQDGSHVYTFNPPNIPPPNEPVTIPSRPLQKHYELPGEDLFDEKRRLEMLRDKGYELFLPENFRNEGLQDDGHNCGPLVLYAALVANKYTPDFKDKADFRKLKAASGIEIV